MKSVNFIVTFADCAFNIFFCFPDNKEILNVVYETNPLDRSCDQRIRLTAEPLLITYDVKTLAKISAMFESKEDVQTELAAAAMQKLESLKKMSALGLEYAMQSHAVLDIDVNIKGSFFILPNGGFLQKTSGKILFNTGNFRFKSVQNDESIPSKKRSENTKVSQLKRGGSNEKDVMDEMLSQSCHKFSVALKDVRVISVLPKEDWTELDKNKKPDVFILKPMSE